MTPEDHAEIRKIVREEIAEFFANKAAIEADQLNDAIKGAIEHLGGRGSRGFRSRK